MSTPVADIDIHSASTAPEAAGPAARSERAVPDIAYSVGAVVILLLAWTATTGSGFIPQSYFPSPRSLVQTFLALARNGYHGIPLSTHVGLSMFRALTGFVVGVATGAPLGLLTGYNRRVGAVVSPIMAFVRPIPPIAFIPMSVLYFGLGELGKIVLIWWVSFTYLHVNAQAGAANIAISYQRAARSLGLSRNQIFWRIVLPGALPQIFTGLKVAMALSWAVVVAAELVGAQAGLGFMISDAAQLFQISTVYVGIILIGAIGLLFNVTLNLLEAHVVHWKGR